MKKQLLTQTGILAVIVLFSAFLPIAGPVFGQTKTPTKKEFFPDSRYEIMAEEELDLEFEIAKYIATRKEKRAYKKLEFQEKKDFLKKFWAKRDSDQTTDLNEFREGFLSRVAYVNEKLSSIGSGRKGWKTDQGRVIIMYGFPDETEHYTLSSENKPYQIWHYFSAEAGVKFIFVDRQLFGNYDLVHSTARNEIQDPDWERWISPTKAASPSLLRWEEENTTNPQKQQQN